MPSPGSKNFQVYVVILYMVTGTSGNTRLRMTVPSASSPETVIFSVQDVAM